MATPRNRVLRVKIANPGVISMLKKDVIDNIVDVANELLPHIADIYTMPDGTPIEWHVKYDTSARAKRMYAVVYSDNPYPKYLEANEGKIAQYLKSISRKDKIRIRTVNGNVVIGG
jgi:hypothetical protein